MWFSLGESKGTKMFNHGGAASVFLGELSILVLYLGEGEMKNSNCRKLSHIFKVAY